jgi:hypothetical protein
MDAVTYPTPSVVDFLSDQFVCLKLDTSARSPAFRRILGRQGLRWTPTFVFADHTVRELRRTVGFLPPDDFLAELQLVLGLAGLARARNETALATLRAVADLHPESHVAGEALFWAGIAAFRIAGGEKAALRVAWQPLWERYPDSTWARRAAVWPDQLSRQ